MNIPTPLSKYIATKSFPSPQIILEQLHQQVTSISQDYLTFLEVIKTLNLELKTEYLESPIFFTKSGNSFYQQFIKPNESWFERRVIFIKDESGFFPTMKIEKK